MTRDRQSSKQKKHNKLGSLAEEQKKTRRLKGSEAEMAALPCYTNNLTKENTQFCGPAREEEEGREEMRFFCRLPVPPVTPAGAGDQKSRQEGRTTNRTPASTRARSGSADLAR